MNTNFRGADEDYPLGEDATLPSVLSYPPCRCPEQRAFTMTVLERLIQFA
jgi:hypothetical protein